jgi:hypothetical protein
LPVVVAAQDLRDPAPGHAVAGRQREVEVVEHARRDVHREHRLERACTVRRPAERVERLTEGQHEVEGSSPRSRMTATIARCLCSAAPAAEIDSFCVSSGVGAISSLSVSK